MGNIYYADFSNSACKHSVALMRSN